MKELSNRYRAAVALQVVRYYQHETGTDEECALRDLLCDLRHFCDANDLSFAKEDSIAQAHYTAEVVEEREQR